MELKTKTIKDTIMSNPEAVYNAIKVLWGEFPEYDKGRENMFLLYLNTKNRLLCVELHCQGTIDHIIAYPREIIRKALFSNAAGIILVHNHPSGSNTPSSQDHLITKKIKEACKIMDINVLDHLIIGEDEQYYSFQEKGEL